jgi:hypothetical protein
MLVCGDPHVVIFAELNSDFSNVCAVVVIVGSFVYLSNPNALDKQGYSQKFWE